jgi:hypothetical protein
MQGVGIAGSKTKKVGAGSLGGGMDQTCSGNACAENWAHAGRA